jgi:hypothetical protein
VCEGLILGHTPLSTLNPVSSAEAACESRRIGEVATTCLGQKIGPWSGHRMSAGTCRGRPQIGDRIDIFDQGMDAPPVPIHGQHGDCRHPQGGQGIPVLRCWSCGYANLPGCNTSPLHTALEIRIVVDLSWLDSQEYSEKWLSQCWWREIQANPQQCHTTPASQTLVEAMSKQLVGDEYYRTQT